MDAARRARLAAGLSLLRSLSPLAVLDRGYAICLDPARGRVVRSFDQVASGDQVEVRLARGALDCSVETARETGGRVMKKDEAPGRSPGREFRRGRPGCSGYGK
jgi:exodeoxyribonuclease VII large subunit